MARTRDLDLCGLKCPLPVLRTRKALRAIGAGETLTVLCTDPLAVIDIPHLARSEGHDLVAQAVEGAVLRFVIVKGGERGAEA